MRGPKNIVLVRHGQSEANVEQKKIKSGETIEVPQWYKDTPDYKFRLSKKGVLQAESAGVWIAENILPFCGDFDKALTTTHVRGMETAGHLAIGGLKWRIDDRVREREWGIYGQLSNEERERRYPEHVKLKKSDPFFWRADGGESIADVTMRVRQLRDRLEEEMIGGNVIITAHGEYIDATRYVNERMTHEQWLYVEADEAQKVANCMIVHYTRVNPDTREETDKLNWVRGICPWDETKSWFAGEWRQIPLREEFTSEELLGKANEVPRYLF
jgi:broad specificity phosphatase PhoE